MHSGEVNVAIGENSTHAFWAYLQTMFSYKEHLSQEEQKRLELLLLAVEHESLNSLNSVDGGWKLKDAVFGIYNENNELILDMYIYIYNFWINSTKRISNGKRFKRNRAKCR